MQSHLKALVNEFFQANEYYEHSEHGIEEGHLAILMLAAEVRALNETVGSLQTEVWRAANAAEEAAKTMVLK